MQFKKFKSVDNREKRIALLSGHVYLIAGDWKSIPQFAWQECYAAGCMSDDMITKAVFSDGDTARVVDEINDKARQKVELEALFKGWVADNLIENFDAKKRPKVTLVSEHMGFRVPAKLRDEVWFDMVENGRV